jgi:hypothetical protein
LWFELLSQVSRIVRREQAQPQAALPCWHRVDQLCLIARRQIQKEVICLVARQRPK